MFNTSCHLVIEKSNQTTDRDSGKIRIVYNTPIAIKAGTKNSLISTDISIYKALYIDNHIRVLSALSLWIQSQRFTMYRINNLELNPLRFDIEFSIAGINIAPLHKALQRIMLLMYIRTNKEGWYINKNPSNIVFAKFNTELPITDSCYIQLSELKEELECSEQVNNYISYMLEMS